MKGLLLTIPLFFSLVASAAERVSFSEDITKKSLDKLVENIRKTAGNLKEGAERVIIIDLDSGGGDLYATMKFVENTPALSTELNVTINTRVKSDCESACTVLFTAGTERIAKRWASFGFHSPAVASRLPKNVSRKEVIEEARRRWIDAINAVDSQLAADLERRGLLLRDEMTLLDAKEVNHGYVTLLE